MAVYKVPQDVEAEDKLIGPFSFRQFIYIIVAVISIAIAWGLSQIFIPLAVVPLPLIVFFGALALPLRKDQPMEIYLAAVVSFYLKPRKRLWQPDGIQSLVQITAPKTVEIQRAKALTETEAQRRLSYLADIVDTGGWSVRGVTNPAAPTPMQNDVFFEAQQTEDILDDNGGVSRSFDTMINQSDTRRRQEMIDRMRQQPTPAAQPPRPTLSVPDPYATLTPNANTTTAPTPQDPRVTYNPYPTSIHQSIVNPLDPAESIPVPTPAIPTPEAVRSAPTISPTPRPAPADNIPPATSEKPISPDIINLANNPDLSIETIAHEANRIHQKEEERLPEDEVVISLR